MTDGIPRVLVVEDDASLRELLGIKLSKAGYEPLLYESASLALRALETEVADAVLTDLRMNEMDGIAFCERVTLNRPEIPVIVMTAHSNVEAAVAALRAKAFDFLSKPLDMAHLLATLEGAVRQRATRSALAKLQTSPSDPTVKEVAVGKSQVFRDLMGLVERVSPLDTSVLIVGESGTGKELIARALHNGSPRAPRPFVAINCAAVPENLLEAELFGCLKGAFTDARADRPGLFVEATHGTLLLDEIGEMPLHLQPKLLRALQERVVRPLGGVRETRIDVRVLAATNKDLSELIKEGKFREDLYYRINVIELRVPPLRERGGDILLCAQRFLEMAAQASGRRVLGFTPEVADRLLSYDWPGNVRELQNTVERAVAFARHDKITVDDLPQALHRYRTTHVMAEEGTDLRSLEEVERAHIARVLQATNGNKTLAAQILGVDRRTLYRKNERYESRHKSS